MTGFTGGSVAIGGGLLPTPDGMVRITRQDTGTSVLLRLDEDNATKSGGIGGWTPIGRPYSDAVTYWRAPTDPRGLSVAVFADGYPSTSIEGTWDRLEAMGEPDLDETGPDAAPPYLTLAGMVPGAEYTWVLQNIEEGKAVWQPGPFRVQQFAVLTFMRPRRPSTLRARSLTSARRASGAAKNRVIRSVKGDTLVKIALRELGDSTRWDEVYDENRPTKKGKPSGRAPFPRDPRRPLKAGTRVKLPKR
jgi:nucleoid-associated protein YgaU